MAWKPSGTSSAVEHGHVVGQLGVQGPLQHLGRQAALSVRKADDLAQGMHAGVGPSAGQRRRPLAGDLLDRLFQRRLGRSAAPAATCQPA